MISRASSLTCLAEAYKTKEVSLKFRGRELGFALSQGLFSASAIDTGTRLLLKVLSRIWDEDAQRGLPGPKMILDAGCGIGVIGICAGAALVSDESCRIRCQDRDELARLFTEYNALKNGVSLDLLSAHTEPILGGPSRIRWDLILSNVPAKAGKPVLEDFIFRSAGLLNPAGRVLVVVINPLAIFFRSRISMAGAPLLYEEQGKEHTVFLYGFQGTQKTPVQGGEPFFHNNPAYHRGRALYKMEGIPYALDSIEGVRDFDSPGGTVQVAAKLVSHLGREKLFPSPDTGILIHEPAQGHFPVWLFSYLKKDPAGGSFQEGPLVLSGRNILALEASRHNIRQIKAGAVEIIPLVDLRIPQESPQRLSRGWDLIIAFPEVVPQTNRFIPLWEGIQELLLINGILIIAFSSSEAERFDLKKPKPFTRLGDLKRKGFRALAYQLQEHLKPSVP